MKKAMRYVGVLAVLILLLSSVAMADNGPPLNGSGVGFPNPLKEQSIHCLIADILKIVANIGAIIAVLFIIYSGFLFVTAQGDVKKVTDARRTFLYTVIGTAILLGAWGLANIIATTIGEVTSQDIGAVTNGC